MHFILRRTGSRGTYYYNGESGDDPDMNEDMAKATVFKLIIENDNFSRGVDVVPSLPQHDRNLEWEAVAVDLQLRG